MSFLWVGNASCKLLADSEKYISLVSHQKNRIIPSGATTKGIDHSLPDLEEGSKTAKCETRGESKDLSM